MPTETGNTCPILTGTRQSGLSREHIHGKVQPMDYDTEHHIGAILAVLAVIGVGLYLWSVW
jgi:hypothetical protein